MRSDAVKKGIAQAPQRSLMRALGLTEEEMKKPLVGIVSSYNEIVPGHMNLENYRSCKNGRCHGRRNTNRIPGHCSL